MKINQYPTIREEMNRILYQTREASAHQLRGDIVAIVWGEYVFCFDAEEYRSALRRRLSHCDDDWVDAINFYCEDLAATARGKRALADLARIPGISRNVPKPF